MDAPSSSRADPETRQQFVAMLEETGEDFVRAQVFDGWRRLAVERWLYEKAWARAKTDEERATLALELARKQYEAAKQAEEASRDTSRSAVWSAVVLAIAAVVVLTATALFLLWPPTP